MSFRRTRPKTNHLVRISLRIVPVAMAILAAVTPSHADFGDDASLTRPRNALVMPFDVTGKTQTLLAATNVGGTLVTTHWSFYDEGGTFLADAFTCLDPGAAKEVNPRQFALGVGGATTDLGGRRGLLVVTAYVPDSDCRPSAKEPLLVDDAIVGEYSIDEGALNYGGNAIGLATGILGDGTAITALPRATLESSLAHSGLKIPTQAPDGLRASRLLLLYVRERGGVGSLGSFEIGPVPPSLGHVEAAPVLRDRNGVATSLPEIQFDTALFTSLKPGAPGGLVPRTISVSSGGLLEFIEMKNSFLGLPVVGWNGFVFAIHGQRLKKHSVTTNGTYALD